ncbi:uncharacterized protein SCHCODRAFT_02579958 [Schizophyllum commune H4-8]|nr:uncharacterized protein SCHCODRAFT_02579958 [Schizophyllum commune H4-8]KAI5890908.1 hypothetical protein SCHCODRAFT_02579958 [Schizophyllum commune H4-8]
MEADAGMFRVYCKRFLCSEDRCRRHYSNVGNVNRHRVTDHGRFYSEIEEERKSGRKQYKTIVALVVKRRKRQAGETTTSEERSKMDAGDLANASTSPNDVAQQSRRTLDLESQIIPPLPPLAGLVDPQQYLCDAHHLDPYTDFRTGDVDDVFGAAGVALHHMEGPIPPNLPGLINTTPVSSPSFNWVTPPPSYPAHPSVFSDDCIWARQGFSQTLDSEPVNEKFPSLDATSRALSPRSLAYQPAAMASYPPVAVANFSSAPTMGFSSASTTDFPPAHPTQSEGLWWEQMEPQATFRQQRHADAFRQQQQEGVALQREIASAQHRMVHAPRQEQDAGMVRVQQRLEEDPWSAAMVQELHALAQQQSATSPATYVPADFDHLAPAAGTSDLQQSSYASYPPPQPDDFSLYPHDRVRYEQQAPSAFEWQLFPAFDLHHRPALEPRKQISHASFDCAAQPAFDAPTFDDAFMPWSSFH